MGFVVRASSSVAVAAVIGATVVATPVQRPTPAAENYISTSVVTLAASTEPFSRWPLVLTTDEGTRSSAGAPTLTSAAVDAQDAATTADEIDESFIDFRRQARSNFHQFANQFGYLGKQLYVAVNFGESILASAIFNGTDILRGEGVLKNLGEFASDIALAAIWVVADELYLHLPGLPPIEILPNRGPEDAPQSWRRPLPPQPGRPLIVPFDPVDDTAQQQTNAESSDDEGVTAHDNAASEDTETLEGTKTSTDVEAHPDIDEGAAQRKTKNGPREGAVEIDETETESSAADESEAEESESSSQERESDDDSSSDTDDE